MPFKLCNCDKVKLNEVIDQVTKLSETVDELRAEINSMKICSIVASKESFTVPCEKLQKERSKIGTGTFYKLKKCLEKRIVPIISMEAGQRVKDKCQQLFTQSPRKIVPCSGDVPCRKYPINQQIPSPTKTNKNLQNNRCCSTLKSKETEATKSRLKKLPHKCRENICKESKKNASLPISSASSTKSLKKYCNRTTKKSGCSYELCNAKKSSRKLDEEKTVNKIEKKRTCDASSNCSRSPLDDRGELSKNQDTCVKRQRNVNLVNRKTFCDLQNCKIIKESKRDNKLKRILKGSPKREKKSILSRCSSNCSYMKRPNSNFRDASTNTIFENFTNQNCQRVGRVKRLKCKETQISSENNKMQDSYHGRRCFKTENTNWLQNGSLTSLISGSSVDNYHPEPKKFLEELVQRSDKWDSHEEEKKKQRYRETQKPAEKIISPTRPMKKIFDQRIELESDSIDEMQTKNRRKRTYIVSSDISSPKNDETVQCDFDEHPKNISSLIENERSGDYSGCRKRSKKPEVTLRVCQARDKHQRTIFQFTCPKESKNRYKKTVCTNRSTESNIPKFYQWSRRKAQRSRNETSIRPQVCGNSSSTSCTLISDSDCLEESVVNPKKVIYPTKNLTKASICKSKSCSSSEKNVAKYSICGSLSGSVRSVTSESC